METNTFVATSKEGKNIFVEFTMWRLDWNVLERNPLLREKKYVATVVTGVDSTSKHVETPLRTLVTSAASDRSDVLIWMQWTEEFLHLMHLLQLDYFFSLFLFFFYHYFEIRFFFFFYKIIDEFKWEGIIRITMAVNRLTCTTNIIFGSSNETGSN